MNALHFQLVLAWVWIWLGFLSGFALGLFFHREDWFGGYTSLKRRLYRLCHISFFGLGALNLCFYLTVQACGLTGVALTVASWAFIVGAVFMPFCCLLMAHFPRTRLLFGLPVMSLLVGGGLIVFAMRPIGVAFKGTPGFSAASFGKEKPLRALSPNDPPRTPQD
jgi:hypothetical protein